MSATNYEQRAVLFLDVLGFQRLIDERREDLIEDALEIICAQYQSNYAVSAFSDNMAVSLPFRNGYELAELIQFASSLTLHLLHKGVLSRGGISVGEIHHKGNFIYGPALVEAYKLEKYAAKYPRVVLASDAVAKSLQVGGNPSGCEEFIRGFLRTDSDGLEHVHFLDHKALMPFHIMLPLEVQAAKGQISFKALIDAKLAAIIKALESNPATDNNAREKHEWLKQYAAEYDHFYTIVQNPPCSMGM